MVDNFWDTLAERMRHMRWRVQQILNESREDQERKDDERERDASGAEGREQRDEQQE